MGVYNRGALQVIRKQQLAIERRSRKDFKNFQNHSKPRNGVFYVAQPLDAELLFAKQRAQTFLGRLTGHLDIRQLPKACIHDTRWTQAFGSCRMSRWPVS